mmetsp:Transcript_12851/g.11440  ORF Transcript_12851/g.11440 Transcript_12851/m.11440 type:complete len:179 (+) Transcript_12851:66-602(+)
MIFIFINLLIVSIYASFDCNYVDMGFGLTQPVNECTVGKTRDNGEQMSIEYVCIDAYNLESRIYYDTLNCDNDDYEIVQTFKCNSNSTHFVECNCSFYKGEQCPIFTDIEYIKHENGSCDKSQINQYRLYVADPIEIPEPLDVDSNCFERKSTHYGKDASIVSYWMDKLSLFQNSIQQ